MKCLIVEDDLDMAHYIASVLEAQGMGSDIAGSAETARNMFVREDYAALVIDAILPGESGVSLANGLREFDPDIPILFCTGATDEFNKKLLGALGIVCHKPLDTGFPELIRQFAGSLVQR